MRTLAWVLADHSGGYLRDPDKLGSPLPTVLFKTKAEALAHKETLTNKDRYRPVRVEILIKTKPGLINYYK